MKTSQNLSIELYRLIKLWISRYISKTISPFVRCSIYYRILLSNTVYKFKFKKPSELKYFPTRSHNFDSSIEAIFSSIMYPLENLFFMCYELPKHWKIPPFTIIPIFVLNASASSILCVVRTIALVLLFAILAITYHIKRRASGSIPADGSSRRIIGGLPTRANATQTLRLLPPERVPAVFFRYS